MEKLNIELKINNGARQKLINEGLISSEETVSNEEFNSVVSKTNELVEAFNFGAPITAFNFLENVPTYEDLPPTGNQVNDGYGVLEDGLIYVWNGVSFQSKGNGIDLGLKPIGKVKQGDKLAVSGEEVESKTILKNSLGLYGNIFDVNNVVYDKYINSEGKITSFENASYGVIDVNSEDQNIIIFLPRSFGNGRRFAFYNDDALVSVFNMKDEEINLLAIPNESNKLAFTIDSPPSPIHPIDKTLITANYGTELIDFDKLQIQRIEGKEIVASSLLQTNENVIFVEENGLVGKKYSENLCNPLYVVENSTWLNGEYIPSNAYHVTGPIEVEYGVIYYFSSSNGITPLVRSWRELDKNGVQLNTGTAGSHTSFTPISVNCKKVMFVFYNTIPPNGLCVSKTSKEFTEYNELPSFVLKQKQNGAFPETIVTLDVLESFKQNQVIFNLKDTDKILWTGSSSVESYYSPDKKSFVNKLQDFIDIMIVPYGWTGQNALSIAEKLIQDLPSQIMNGVKPSELFFTMVFIGQTLNSGDLLAQEFATDFIKSNEKLLRAAVTRLGAKPIVGTAYRTEQRVWIENSLKQLADKWGADFIPFGSYHSTMIRNGKFSGFYGSGHPAIRTMDAYTLPLLKYAREFDRPDKSILIFNARNQSLPLSELIYFDNMQRAEKFQSIQVGEMALDEQYQEMYDRLDETGYTIKKKNTSEYMKLFRKQSVSLTDIALIEIIVPRVKTTSISIELASIGISEFYLFNNYTDTWVLVSSLNVKDSSFIEFDKIKILLKGENISISDISVKVIGGVDKPKQATDKIVPPKAGISLFGGIGFDSDNLQEYDFGTNTLENLTNKYGSIFNDMPLYLGESKDYIELNGNVSKTFSIGGDSFGYKTLRVWTCAKLNPKIYNSTKYVEWVGDNNPYTDITWYGAEKYDYDDLNIVLEYLDSTNRNRAKSINVQKVGLFWNLGYVDIIMPIVEAGNYKLTVSRGTNHNNYPMYLSDIKMEIV